METATRSGSGSTSGARPYRTPGEVTGTMGCARMSIETIEAKERCPSKELAIHLARTLVLPLAVHPIVIRVARADRAPARPVGRSGARAASSRLRPPLNRRGLGHSCVRHHRITQRPTRPYCHGLSPSSVRSRRPADARAASTRRSPSCVSCISAPSASGVRLVGR